MNQVLEQNIIEEVWSTGYFKDQFLLDLTNTKCDTNNGTFLSDKKYYRQVMDLMYRIPLTEQIPKTKEGAVPFIINFSDLSSRIQKEFTDYCKLYDKRHVTLLLKEVVIRLFENIDYEKTHMSVMRKLRVVLEP